jgi:hypothetical protein
MTNQSPADNQPKPRRQPTKAPEMANQHWLDRPPDQPCRPLTYRGGRSSNPSWRQPNLRRELQPDEAPKEPIESSVLTLALASPAMSQPSPNAAQTDGPACADLYDLASRFAAAAERAVAQHEPGAGSDVEETDLRSLTS